MAAAPAPVPTPLPAAAPWVADTKPVVEAAPAASPSSSQVSVSAALEPTPRSRLDPQQDAERRDLWQRVRDGFVLPDLNGDLVRNWEQYYATRPDYVQRMTERGSRYLFHITEEVERRELPMELVLLPFIESAFNPQAMSTAKASGMWQFMPATGKDFDLRQNLFRDDRRSVLASTRAALDYLERLYKRFGDWQLALAAYNWGQGNVQRAVDNNRARGLPTGYTHLAMPVETRNYVPKLQAVKNIVMDPQRFGLKLPELHNHPYFLSVDIDRDIDVAAVARMSGLTVEEFLQLNPQLNKPVILASGTPQVLLPYDNANRFLRELPRASGPLASWTAWIAPRSVKPHEAARLVGMSEEQLREVNRIPERMVVKAGSTLLVPRAAHTTADVSGRVADNAAISLAPEARPLRRVSFKAGRKGDSVAAVAKRYGLNPALVAQWNKVTPTAQFKAGQAVVVMLPAAPPGARAKAAAPAVAVATARKTAPVLVQRGQNRATPKVQRTASAAGPAQGQRVAIATGASKTPAQNRTQR